MVRIRPLVAAAIAAMPMAVIFTATSADAHNNRHGYYSQHRSAGNYHRSWRNSRWFAVRRHGNRHR